MKKFLFFVTLIIVLILVGCGNVNNKDIINDLPDEITAYCYENRDNIKYFDKSNIDITIDKRTKEEKSDIIYCTLTMEDDNIKKIASYILYYNKYDEGGWILDSWALDDESSVTPVKYPTTEEIENNLYNTYAEGIDNLGVDKLECKNETDNIYYIERVGYFGVRQKINVGVSYELNVDDPDLEDLYDSDVDLSDKITYCHWNYYRDEDYSIDFSGLIGKYSSSDNSEYEIVSINEDSAVINYTSYDGSKKEVSCDVNFNSGYYDNSEFGSAGSYYSMEWDEDEKDFESPHHELIFAVDCLNEQFDGKEAVCDDGGGDYLELEKIN